MFQALADDVEQRRRQILKIIDEEILEVRRLTNQSRKDPDLMLRLAELNLEKARLWREKENQDYLKLPEKVRRKAKKSNYFKRSNTYFNKANKVCIEITKRFRNYSRMGEVYYILGFNAKESNNAKKASKYLSLATRNSKKKSIKIKTQVTLAEVYYNQKKYQKAIPLYEKSLKTIKDKWWTKDSFNLAWCYFQTNRYSKAINLMKQVYQKSASTKFIDMRSEVARDIGLFYATSGKIKEGISFYQNLDVDFSGKLISIARNLVTQGQFMRAGTVLGHAEKYEKDPKKRVEIHIEQLYLFERDNKMNSHRRVARELYKSSQKKLLDSTELKRFIFQLEKVAATLQRQVISKTYRRVIKVRRAKASQAIEYFNYLAKIEPKKSEEFLFLKAETAYAAKLNKEAFLYYRDSFNFSEKLKKPKFLSKSMDGMLVTLSLKVNSSSKNNIETFEAFLRNWKKGKKAKGIYTRLFNNYISVNNYTKAKDVLERYRDQYPKDYKTQEAMIAKLMDIDRKKKDNNAIRAWISSIDAGKYAVSGKFSRKLKELLTTIQIEDVQQQLNKGKKKDALVGYHKILQDPYSTKRSKINAKYNLSALYFELNDPENAYKWSISAIDEMEVKDVLQFSTSFVTIANFLFTSLEYEKSANLSQKYMLKICKKFHKKKNISFKNAIFIYLADGKVREAEQLVKRARKCKIRRKNIDLAEFEILREHRKRRNWNRHEYYVNKLSRSKFYRARMIDEYLYLMSLHRKFSNKDKEQNYKKKAWNLYYKAKKSKEIISMNSLDYFASFMVNRMEKTAEKIQKIKYAFPEKVFAARQQQKLKLLEKLTSQASDVQAIGSGVGIVNSFKILQDSYLGVAAELLSFDPPKKSKEYVVAFKKDMKNLSLQITKAADQYRAEAIRAIKSNLILNKNNFYFQPGKFPIKFFGEESALLMDRGGNK